MISTKYQPKCLNDLITNKDKFNLIKSWIDNFYICKNSVLKKTKKNKKNINLLIVGEHGIGKTITIKTLIKDLGFELINLDITIFNKCKDNDLHIKAFIENTNVINTLNEFKKTNHIILIDNLENITSTSDKNIIKKILKYNNSYCVCPIIYIVNNKHNNFITSIKDNTTTIYFNQPTYDDMYNLLGKICSEEKIMFSDINVINTIISFCQQDFNRLLTILQDFKNYKKTISDEYLKTYLSISNKKDKNDNIFMATANLLTKFINIDECMKIYATQKTYIPLTFHQNYINYVNKFYSESTYNKLSLSN